jgi:UDP-N-acetylmuramyl pentapeptide phosphotransferase/UDP-N-acetylglucosamine-1-phosphate transferase
MIAFLFFNLSYRHKVFMGDCGSLLLGFLMCGFSLQLMEASCCDPALQQVSGNELALVFLALFSLPVVDLFRVIFVRLLKRKPIFGADRNHLHHLLLDKLNGRAHIYTAMLLFFIHLTLILLALFAM